MGSEQRKRNRLIQVRVTDDEKKAIEERAALYSSGTTADYLRSLGLDQKLRSKSDMNEVKKLVKIGADFGRVGGLIKLFVAQREHRYSPQDFDTMHKFIRELENTRSEIAEAIKKRI